MGSEEQQRDALTAEEVAMRLEGKRKFEVMSRETVYYSRIVWATNADEAENICMTDGDWGDAVDYANWELDGVEEY
jgi:hypothetical protein